MKKFIISEEEKRKILYMHKSPEKKPYLFEEDETMDMETEPQDTEIEEPSDEVEYEMEYEQSPEEMAADKVEQVIDNPKVENRIEMIVDRLSEKQKMILQKNLEQMGITPESSIEDIHQIIQSNMEETSTAEMMEGEEKSDKQKVADFLEGIGGGNIAAWGGVPLAIAIGGTVGSMAIGFAASWGLTGLLYGVAKLLSDKK